MTETRIRQCLRTKHSCHGYAQRGAPLTGPGLDPSWHGQSQWQYLWQGPKTIHSWHGQSQQSNPSWQGQLSLVGAKVRP